MAHQRVAFLTGTRFEKEPHPYVLGARAAQAKFAGEVAAERAGDEEQGFSVFDGWIELAIGAREHWRAPWRELIRLQAAREQDCMPPRAAELALQLALTDCSHRAECSQTEQVQ